MNAYVTKKNKIVPGKWTVCKYNTNIIIIISSSSFLKVV